VRVNLASHSGSAMAKRTTEAGRAALVHDLVVHGEAIVEGQFVVYAESAVTGQMSCSIY